MISRDEVDRWAHRTISPRAFYAILANRLRHREPLSVVRMGDGERELFAACTDAIKAGLQSEHVCTFDKAWRTRMGIEGITWGKLLANMVNAMTEAEYYGPSVSGLTNRNYCLYDWFERYVSRTVEDHKKIVDNFFVNDLKPEQHAELYKAAGKIIIVHRNPVTANCLARRAKMYLNVNVVHVPMETWQQADVVVDACAELFDYPLALVSAGPASKWIIPELAKQGRVAIDLGNGMDHWLIGAIEQAAKALA